MQLTFGVYSSIVTILMNISVPRNVYRFQLIEFHCLKNASVSEFFFVLYLGVVIFEISNYIPVERDFELPTSRTRFRITSQS